MSDQFFKGLLDEVINTRIKVNELDKENKELVEKNKVLTEELTKIRNMVLTYQKDYYKKINYETVEESDSDSSIVDDSIIDVVVVSPSVNSNDIVINAIVNEDETNSIETLAKSKNRNEYMKEYMKNKRKKDKEDKKIIVNKK